MWLIIGYCGVRVSSRMYTYVAAMGNRKSEAELDPPFIMALKSLVDVMAQQWADKWKGLKQLSRSMIAASLALVLLPGCIPAPPDRASSPGTGQLSAIGQAKNDVQAFRESFDAFTKDYRATIKSQLSELNTLGRSELGSDENLDLKSLNEFRKTYNKFKQTYSRSESSKTFEEIEQPLSECEQLLQAMATSISQAADPGARRAALIKIQETVGTENTPVEVTGRYNIDTSSAFETYLEVGPISSIDQSIKAIENIPPKDLAQSQANPATVTNQGQGQTQTPDQGQDQGQGQQAQEPTPGQGQEDQKEPNQDRDQAQKTTPTQAWETFKQNFGILQQTYIGKFKTQLDQSVQAKPDQTVSAAELDLEVLKDARGAYNTLKVSDLSGLKLKPEEVIHLEAIEIPLKNTEKALYPLTSRKEEREEKIKEVQAYIGANQTGIYDPDTNQQVQSYINQQLSDVATKIDVLEDAAGIVPTNLLWPIALALALGLGLLNSAVLLFLVWKTLFSGQGTRQLESSEELPYIFAYVNDILARNKVPIPPPSNRSEKPVRETVRRKVEEPAREAASVPEALGTEGIFQEDSLLSGAHAQGLWCRG